MTSDIISQYFKKGAEVEVSRNDVGFRGSWYVGTVVRPSQNDKSKKVLVEYKTSMKSESSTKRLTEEVELVQLRPAPPPEKRIKFNFSEEVDAWYNDGWWEGIVTELLGGDKYAVFFRGTREQLHFRARELRLHREWVYGKWVPPLVQQASDDQPPRCNQIKQMLISKDQETEEEFDISQLDSILKTMNSLQETVHQLKQESIFSHTSIQNVKRSLEDSMNSMTRDITSVISNLDKKVSESTAGLIKSQETLSSQFAAVQSSFSKRFDSIENKLNELSTSLVLLSLSSPNLLLDCDKKGEKLTTDPGQTEFSKKRPEPSLQRTDKEPGPKRSKF